MSELLGSVIKRSLQIRQKMDVKLLSPWAMQKMVFRRLLETGSKTQFGRYYDFRGILMSDNPVETFQKIFPFLIIINYTKNGGISYWRMKRMYVGKEKSNILR
jgi:hypothetical protein